MAFTIYSVACVTFILVCLAMLWPIHVARRRVTTQIRELRAREDLDALECAAAARKRS